MSAITFQISAPLYWGFRYSIEYYPGLTEEDAIWQVKNALARWFEMLNLKELKEGATKLVLRASSSLGPGKFIYLCNKHHCRAEPSDGE